MARMEDTRLPKCVMFVEMVGSAGCVGGHEKEWMGCFLDEFRAFGINADCQENRASRPPVVGHGLTFEYDCSN